MMARPGRPGGGTFVSIAPDGRRTAYTAADNAIIAEAKRTGRRARIAPVHLGDGRVLRFEVQAGDETQTRGSSTGIIQINMDSDNIREIEWDPAQSPALPPGSPPSGLSIRPPPGITEGVPPYRRTAPVPRHRGVLVPQPEPEPEPDVLSEPEAAASGKAAAIGKSAMLLLAGTQGAAARQCEYACKGQFERGCRDEPLRVGTRVRVHPWGEGVYERFEQRRFSANLHHIRFGGGTKTEQVTLSKLRPQDWNVVELSAEHTVEVRASAQALHFFPGGNSSPRTLTSAADLMSPENRRAVEYIATSVMGSNTPDRSNVLSRLPGATVAELDALIEYLQSCPKIVHFPIESVLHLFVQDTHYRNQFETGSSRGTLSASRRQQWESTLFGNSYDNCVTPSSYTVRPKYGVVNVDHDALGCKVAKGTYGEAFLVLKHAEDRVTYSWGDSGGLSEVVGNTDGAARTSLAFGVWMCRLLSAMPDEDLKTIRGLANGQIQPGTARLSTYLEFQVHGPIRFAHDVASVMVPKRFRRDKAMVARVEQFSGQFGIAVAWVGADRVVHAHLAYHLRVISIQTGILN
jgi:hypothetical protein